MQVRVYAKAKSKVAVRRKPSGLRHRTACAVPLIQLLPALLLIGMSGPLVCAQSTDSPSRSKSGAEALKSLRAELDEAGRAWRTKYHAATSDEERLELQIHNSLRAFESRFLEFARSYATAPVAMEAVEWLAETANPGPVFDEGLALVEMHHLEDERIIKMCRTLVFRQSPAIDRFLMAVATKHSNRNVQGVAYLCLARYLNNFREFVVSYKAADESWRAMLQRFYTVEAIAWIQAADPEQLLARTDVICDQIINEYGDVNDDEYADSTGQCRSLADAVKALRFSLGAVGSAAPELVGTGLDGARFSLSDQRGKVVLLMFSANWCGPCKAMYGQLRELTELYEDKSFTVITVMADNDGSTVAKAVDSGEITWPAVWDGRDGPIARAWYITAYPTIYLIDRDGRIQSEGLRDDRLDDEVARMLGINPESRGKVDKRTRVWDLSLRDKNMSDDELPELLEGYTELRSLDLSANPITDAALIHLEPLTKLKTLRLEHTKVTDEGLLILKNLPSLRQLYVQHRVTGEGTTTAGQRKLAKQMPGLNISIITHLAPRRDIP